jgi:hypothetical protein
MEDNEKGCEVPVKEQIGNLRKELSELHNRLVQTEDVLFALCNHFDLVPGKEIIRTGEYYNPFIYRGAVIPK